MVVFMFFTVLLFFFFIRRWYFISQDLAKSLSVYLNEREMRKNVDREFVENERRLKLEILESKLKELHNREVRKNIKWR